MWRLSAEPRRTSMTIASSIFVITRNAGIWQLNRATGIASAGIAHGPGSRLAGELFN